MSTLKWWQSAIFYQIYPRSFADGNEDGVGDFLGMKDKLDYLQKLGVDAIWLSPHYPSPNWDWGYDISDYMAVAPEYGSMDDFIAFLEGSHDRGMHVILDLVLNHTSHEHAWFLESKSNRDNQKSDWYIWHDPISTRGAGPEGEPPNNWQSCFDGSAWTYVPERGQYYYHYFMKQQPDLNWHNPQVKEAMWNIVRFWLDLGVDGFRLDAVGTIFEDPAMTPHDVPLDLAGLRQFNDNATDPAEKELLARYWHDMFKHQWGGQEVHILMKELRNLIDQYPGDRMLVGEDDNIEYMGNGKDELQMVFNFPLMRTTQITPAHIRNNQNERLYRLEKLSYSGWACNTLGNHDCSRLLSAYGDGLHNEALARLHLTLIMTLPGTPFLYYGEEIGMSDLIIDDPKILRDTMSTWYYDRLIDDMHVEHRIAASRAGKMSRDKNRTPMQWRNAPHGGFCPRFINPWLPVNENFSVGINVEEQEQNPFSMLNFYRIMINIRKEMTALVEGKFRPIHETSTDYLAFLRSSNEQTILVVLNFSGETRTIDFSDIHTGHGKIIFSSTKKDKINLAKIDMEAFGLLIILLS